MNEFIFFFSILLTFSAVVLIYKFFGKTGLSSWVCFASVVANIVVVKTVSCFGLITTLGNVLFGSVFLSIDILSEQYGKKEANRAVLLGLIANISFIMASQIVLLYKPYEDNAVQQSFITLFTITPRVCLGSIAAYAFGNFLDTAIFDKLNGKKLWIKNNVSTIIAQLLDNFVLHTIAFLGIISFKEVAILSINVWVIEVIIALLDTPFIYWSKKFPSC